MKKSFLIMRSNLRKAKAQVISISVLMLAAAFMFNLWLMLSLDYKSNFEKSHDRLHSEHVTLSVSENEDQVQDYLNSVLEHDQDVLEYHLDDGFHISGSLPYNGGNISSWFVFMDKETALNRPIGRSEIVEEGNETSGVYLPMIYRSEDLQVGDTIDLTIGNKDVSYNICGFFNNTMMGSHNCYMIEVILSQDKYEELENSAYAMPSRLCSIRLKDRSNNAAYDTRLKNLISKEFPNIIMVNNNYDIVSQSRYISQMVCSGIISAAAFLTLLITLVVIFSNIGNYIQENIQNLGALKAIGYTGTQLIWSLILQFSTICLVTAVVGSGLSYLVFPGLNEMMISQTGIPYEAHFLPIPTALSIMIPVVSVAAVTWFAAKKIRKIEPIVALRQGIETHSFKKNHIPLEKGNLPVNISLALKTTLSHVKQNITVAITMLVLSLIIVFSGLMFENMIRNSDAFLELIAGEMTDSCISIDVHKKDEFLNLMEQEAEVEKCYLYTTETVTHTGHSELYVNISNDFSMVSNKNVCCMGRFPKHDNEVALAAKYAKDQGLKVGDEIALTIGDKEEKYIIIGLVQSSNNFGKDCLLTQNGYEKLAALDYLSYYVDVDDKTDIDQFNQSISDKMEVVNTVNVDQVLSGGSKIYISLMTIIVIAVMILSIVIIIFVLFFLVRTLIVTKKRDYGILKSLGYTSAQLILQTALSFMPAMILSTVIGLVISCFVINPLTAVFLSGIGIVKCTFTIPYGFIIIAGMGMILTAFAIACLLSLRVRKITPSALLAGE